MPLNQLFKFKKNLINNSYLYLKHRNINKHKMSTTQQQSTESTSTEVQTSTVSSTLASLVSLVDSQAKSFRDMSRQLKRLEK